MHRRWLRVAHRGASGSAPEHTRAAFTRALEIGVDMIELDVQLSKDGELVVLHDFELERTTSGKGAVREHTWEALRELDAGSWFGPAFAGERVMTLQEVVQLVGGRARLNVEIKSMPGDGGIVADKLVRLLEEAGVSEQTIVSSFDFQALAAVRARSGRVPIGVLTHGAEVAPIWEVARRLRASSVHPYWALATADVIDAAHGEGLQVIAWTVNDVETMAALIDLGVDGIISDHPERFAQLAAAPGGSAVDSSAE